MLHHLKPGSRAVINHSQRDLVNVQMGLYRTNYLLRTWQSEEAWHSSGKAIHIHGQMPIPAFYIMEPIQHAYCALAHAMPVLKRIYSESDVCVDFLDIEPAMANFFMEAFAVSLEAVGDQRFEKFATMGDLMDYFDEFVDVSDVDADNPKKCDRTMGLVNN